MSGFSVNQKQLLLRNKIYGIIKNFEEFFPDELKKTNLHKCTTCDGSGLNVYINKDTGITFWDHGQEQVCLGCGGFGYSVKELNGEYLCQKCKGLGCSKCKNTGKIDWITRIMGNE
jgi:DnaJ-class molecular chaperone